MRRKGSRRPPACLRYPHGVCYKTARQAIQTSMDGLCLLANSFPSLSGPSQVLRSVRRTSARPATFRDCVLTGRKVQ